MREDGMDRNEELRNSYELLARKPRGEKSLPTSKHKVKCDIVCIDEIIYEHLTNSHRFEDRF
jgi:hypothetical protein